MAQQPYIEQPSDVFNPIANPTDWLEVIDSGSSPSNTTLTNDGQEATLVGYIPWNKQRSAAEWFLGFAYVDSKGVLHRDNPEAHPIFPWLYASEIHFTPFNPAVNPNSSQGQPLQFISPFFGNGLVGINIAYHRMALCSVRFRNFRFSFVDDSEISDPRLEWMRNVYLDLDPKVEALSVDGISQLVFAEGVASGPGGPQAGEHFPAPLAQLLGKNGYILNWLNVPFDYLSTEPDYFYPSNILACLGCVNACPFPYGSVDPFDPGTLLCEGVKFTQKIFPVAPADPSSPLVSVDVAIDLKYFQPPKGNISSSFEGHNLMPWRGGLLPGGASDPSGGKFFYCTRDGTAGGPPLLPSIDFNQIFKNPNV